VKSSQLASLLAALALAGCATLPTGPHPAASEPAGESISAQGFVPLPLWTKQVVGTLPANTHSQGWDVSDNGIVVGETVTLPNGTDIKPFYWTQSGGIRQLPLPVGATAGRAYAISDNGLYAAGNAIHTGGLTVPVRWSLAGPTVAILQRCGGSLIGTGTAVNDAGVVVGNTGSVAAIWPTARSCQTSIVVQGTMMTQARGLNDLGTVVGLGFQPRRGFHRSATLAGKLLPLSADSWSEGHAVNDVNLVVGRSWRTGVYTAVSWSNVGQPAVVLGALHSAGHVAISDRQRAVWGAPNGTALTRKGTTTTGLNLFPHGVNACGDIVGTESGLAVLYQKRYCD
jgi:hypothetical protein